MITNKYINKIIIGLLIVAIIYTGIITFFPNILDIKANSSELEYATQLFDKNKIMSIDIKVDENEWKNMLENATKEEYIPCDVTINGTTFKSVGIRPKGNSSLSMVAGSDSDRFSFKLEFDHYINGQTCFGLDKFVINNIQADATYMKEHLSYDLMSYMGVTTPLYSYTDVTVNGENWGFYLAVEALEESFAQRNFGSDYGKLYKPESMNMGKNSGMKDFGDMKAPPWNDGADKEASGTKETDTDKAKTDSTNQENIKNKTNNIENNSKQGDSPEKMKEGFGGGMPGDFPGGDFGGGKLGDFPGGDFGGGMPGDFPGGDFGGGKPGGFPDGFGGGGADLKYTDDSIDSYSNIFDSEVFKGTNSDYKRVIKALKNLNDGTELEKYINVDATLRYFAANTVLVNLDSYFGSFKHNYYLYEKDGQLTMLPWDYNLAFGGFQSGSASSAVNFPIDTPVSGVDISERPILAKLLEVDEYMDKYHQYLQEIVDGYFNSGTFDNTITQLDALISEYVKNDATAFYNYDAYTKAVDTIKEFGKLRAQSIQGQLNGTIPSTTDGQAAASDKLINASSINLSTMGSQGGGGGGLGNRMNSPDKTNQSGNSEKQPPNEAQQSGNGKMQPPNGVQQSGDGKMQSPNGEQPFDNGKMQQPNGEQPFGNGKMQPPGGEQPFGNMPDGDTMMKAMQIIQGANGKDLTEEQLSQLKDLGLTDDQISFMKNMFGQGGRRGGFGGRPDKNGQAGKQGNMPQPMGMGNFRGQESTLSSMDISVIIISVVCLLAGLLFVTKFKRVKKFKQ